MANLKETDQVNAPIQLIEQLNRNETSQPLLQLFSVHWSVQLIFTKQSTTNYGKSSKHNELQLTRDLSLYVKCLFYSLRPYCTFVGIIKVPIYLRFSFFYIWLLLFWIVYWIFRAQKCIFFSFILASSCL